MEESETVKKTLKEDIHGVSKDWPAEIKVVIVFSQLCLSFFLSVHVLV